jgi:hypothetical protein
VGNPKFGLPEHTGGYGKTVPITDGPGLTGASALISIYLGTKIYEWQWQNTAQSPSAILKTHTMGMITTNAMGSVGSLQATVPASITPATGATSPVTIRGSWSSCTS